MGLARAAVPARRDALISGFGFRVLKANKAGWVGTAAIALSFVAAVGTLISLQGHDPHHRQLVSSLYNYASTVGIDAKMSILVDPLSVWMILIVTGISTLIHLYAIAYMEEDRGFDRFFAYLNFFVFSMLLLVLAGNFLLLIVGWAFVGAASYLLISFWYRRKTATEAGLKAFVINVVGDVGLVLGTYFIFKHTGTLELLGTFNATAHGAFGRARRRRPHRGLHPAARRRVREVRPDPAAHLAPRRDGRPDAGQRADPRGDDGHGRRLPDRAHAPAVRTRAGRTGRRRRRGLRDPLRRGHDRALADRHQARDRLLDDVADRLHDHGRLGGRLRGGACST